MRIKPLAAIVMGLAIVSVSLADAPKRGGRVGQKDATTKPATDEKEAIKNFAYLRVGMTEPDTEKLFDAGNKVDVRRSESGKQIVYRYRYYAGGGSMYDYKITLIFDIEGTLRRFNDQTDRH